MAEEIVLDDADIELQLDEGDKKEVEIKIEKEERTSDNEISIEDGIKELKLKLEEEKLARADAERRAREANDQANKAKLDVDDTNMQLLNTAIDTVKRDNFMLKQKMKEAMQVGDYDSVADMQENMANNAAKLMQLENGRVAMENRPKQEAYAPSYDDPVEAFASQLSPKSANWVRSHPEYVTDQRLHRKMRAAHDMAVAEEIRPDTKEYFEFIEDTLKVNKRHEREEESAMSAASAPVSRRSAPAAAPVSRSSTGTGSSNPNIVRLTAAEREMAQMMGMTDKEYAVNKLALIKDGRLN